MDMSDRERSPTKRGRPSEMVHEEGREPLMVYLRLRTVAEGGGEARALTASGPNEVSFRSADGDAGRYSYSGVLGEEASQEQVYATVGAPLVQSFMAGSDGLLFAYGNTNAGKTYTIQGTADSPGLLPRIIRTLLAQLDDGAAAAEAAGYGRVLLGSYMEIYQERIFDLLDPAMRREVLKIKSDRQGRVFIKDLEEVAIRSVADMEGILERGQRNRQVAETQLNHDSSRSHSIFTLKLVQFPLVGASRDTIAANPAQYVSATRLSVVDLAGSERANKSQAMGVRLREASKINTSLSVFGRCIEAMRWNQLHPTRAPRIVPFRESQLTHLLQSYFASQGKACMIVNVHPGLSVFEETRHVLQFSALAQSVSTGAAAESALAQSKRARICELEQETLRLREELLQARVQSSELEALVRDEVAEEFGERIRELERIYKQRVNDVYLQVEEKYGRKVEILQRAAVAQSSSLSAPQENVDSRCENCAQVEEKLLEESQLRMDAESVCGQLRSELGSLKDALANRTQEWHGLQTVCAETSIRLQETQALAKKEQEQWESALLESRQKAASDSAEMQHELARLRSQLADVEAKLLAKEMEATAAIRSGPQKPTSGGSMGSPVKSLKHLAQNLVRSPLRHASPQKGEENHSPRTLATAQPKLPSPDKLKEHGLKADALLKKTAAEKSSSSSTAAEGAEEGSSSKRTRSRKLFNVRSRMEAVAPSPLRGPGSPASSAAAEPTEEESAPLRRSVRSRRVKQN